MSPSRATRRALLPAIALLVPLTPLCTTATAQAASVRPVLNVVNPGFEQGTTGWTFTAGSGVASNNPHGGSKLIYLDAGPGKKVAQTLTARKRGTYDISAWIATGGANGKFVVSVNGTVARTVALPSNSSYSRYTASRVALRKGEQLEIAFESGDGWINADDIMLSPAAPANPRISSSDPKIVEMFNWSKRKANSWVHLPGTVGPLNVDERNLNGSGTAPYAASYWAGYANRSGYYSRDMAHQVAGAAVLGLHAQNRNMLRSFAASSTAEHKYYPAWAFNFDADTYLSIDYHGPDNFVREVPATFELVEKANHAYRWSGDKTYIEDPALWDFYRHATKDFVELHDTANPNGVAEGTGEGIFAGAASYNEIGNEHLSEAGDAIASQYQAYRAMSALAKDKGDKKLAADFEQKAAELKTYFNTTWSGAGSGADMVRAYTTSGQPLTGWGKENSWFMPMKQILDPGPRNDAYLDYIDEQASGSGKPTNIEAVSYLPDTFFNNNRNEAAWKWMTYVYDQKDKRHVNTRQGPNGDYPEVSFTLLSQTVEGLMGVEPDAPNRTLTTESRLPSDIEWLKLKKLEIGGNTFSLRHEGATKSRLANTSGTATYKWEARFPGVHKTVKVNGKARKAKTKVIDGVTYTYVIQSVAPGQKVTVRVR
ncbi:hypothetical protein ABZ705_15585 [Streptomyces sp. NPDC006984]|uniref:hypothetical protein n=1 Tax=Streptomyces sp. NPDC006984 TaxID=3155463 RepID=UPI0033C9CF2F